MTLRIGSITDGPASADPEATWLLGHTERISFRNLRRQGTTLLVDALLQVRCRYLKPGLHPGERRCAAHGFSDEVRGDNRPPPQPRRLGADRFLVVQNHELAAIDLPFPRRTLPVLAEGENDNPCAIAPCATADHRRGSACCRDLQVEILCSRSDTWLEALVRSRLSPYLCKVTREAEDALEAEMISACGFLDDEGTSCTLHGRLRPDGRPAKPDLCSDWPDDGKGLHPGCIFYHPTVKKPKRRT